MVKKQPDGSNMNLPKRRCSNDLRSVRLDGHKRYDKGSSIYE